MPIVSPIATVQQFTNRNAAVQGIKTNGSIQAKLAQTATPSVMAPDNAFGARQQALQQKTQEVQSWSKSMTSLQQQARLQKEANAAAKAAASQPVQTAPGALGSAVKAGVKSTGAVAQNVNIPAASGTGNRAKILQGAQSLLGTGYAWGGGGYGNRSSRGTGKGTQNVIGVDCSGLTSYIYGLVGYKLPRQSDAQLASGYKTSIANAQPGDLIGWGPGGHVAVYAGNGMIIESPKPGGHVQTRKLHARDTQRGVYAVRLRLPGE